ncbi:MAG: endonuclease NucS [Thermoproteota archaeon]
MASARITILREPSLNDAAKALESALSRRSLIVMLCRCSAEYTGRGSSRLGPGDRLVVVKGDGAVLLHRPRGYAPVNWQPDSRVVKISLGSGEMEIVSIRERPREVLRIRVERVYAIMAAEGLADEAEFVEYFSEEELRDYIARNPEIIEPGLRAVNVERKLGRGYADIVAEDREGSYVVIEVKRVTAGVDAVRQLKGYVDYLSRISRGRKVRGILVAPAISRDALLLLNTFKLEYKTIDPAKLYKLAASRRESKSQKQLTEFMGD